MEFATSLFSQIVQVLPRNRLLLMAHECEAERHAKGFSSWDQYVAMLFCQLAQAKSLREISDGLAVTCGKLNHLGMHAAPPKSTLSYANRHRPWELYQKAFFHLRGLCGKESPGKKERFRFKNKLLREDHGNPCFPGKHRQPTNEMPTCSLYDVRSRVLAWQRNGANDRLTIPCHSGTGIPGIFRPLPS